MLFSTIKNGLYLVFYERQLVDRYVNAATVSRSTKKPVKAYSNKQWLIATSL